MTDFERWFQAATKELKSAPTANSLYFEELASPTFVVGAGTTPRSGVLSFGSSWQAVDTSALREDGFELPNKSGASVQSGNFALMIPGDARRGEEPEMLWDSFASHLVRGEEKETDLCFADRVVQAPPATALFVDAAALHELGFEAESELVWGLWGWIVRTRSLEAKPVSKLIWYSAVSSLFHREATKLRAIRWLAAQCAERSHFGSASLEIELVARTSLREQSQRDVETNLLRNTVGAAAALVGGADFVAVLPHDARLQLANLRPAETLLHSQRLARNIGLILQHESKIDVVFDSAGGSYAYDAMTQALCENVWLRLVQLESMSASERKQCFESDLARDREERARALASGDRPRVGETLHPFGESANAKVPAKLSFVDFDDALIVQGGAQ